MRRRLNIPLAYLIPFLLFVGGVGVFWLVEVRWVLDVIFPLACFLAMLYLDAQDPPSR
ncbi:Na+-driven multidrug efflux pump [Deinobacterium chartae]|uniref:Na+-driven multidrug efflux pump n=1 Tax=Deinobacterium chartae TaxID=521158 RepID=A0A841HVW7_9DEIO|nr:hypothetical protein [Deinobacterium chartae]MBB6097661.1 Na+-driven multidrug efflux pump [Deinobacterium chartae]